MYAAAPLQSNHWPHFRLFSRIFASQFSEVNNIFGKLYILFGFILFTTGVSAQFSTCDTTLMNAYLNPQGYYRVWVPTQPCSVYYHSTAPKTGIDAHRDAANLGIPQLIIENAQENSDVSAALWAQGIYQTTGAGSAVWLGMTDSGSTYNWRIFATGATPTYYNWTSGDPNNLRPGCYNGTFGCALCTGTNAYWCAYGEDCAVMNASGQWLDNSCNGTTTGNVGGPPIQRMVILEINTCPVIAKPRDTTICAGNSATLSTNVISGGTAPFTYTWASGGQTTQSITVSPTTTTTYTVEVSDRWHCKTDSTGTVSVSTPTPPTINVSPATICKNTNANVSLNTVSGTATYTWNFGGGTTGSGSGGGPYTVQWATGGTKTISVTVSDNGCTTTATRTVTIDSATAAFTIAPTSTCANQNVTVTVSAVSATANYTWSFGSGNVVSGTGSGPYTVNWSATGPQTVGLTVTDHGCTATASATVTINPAPTPAFTLSPSTTACQGQAVAVTLTGATSGTATYTWNFHGGTVISGSGAGPYSVSWNTAGSQSVDLTVTDGGCSGTAATQSVTITGGITANAGPDISICPAVPGQLGAPAVSGYTYSWSPALGLSSATAANPTITIPVNPLGRPIDTFYVVTATSGSCSATDTVHVTLYPNPSSAFTINPTATCVGVNVAITYSGVDSGSAAYSWNFNGGNVVSGSGAGPYSVNWTAPGTPAVTLTVTDHSCTSTTSNTVNVSSTLSPSFTLNPSTTACAGQPVSVTIGGSPSGTATYTWNFNGATVASGTGAGPYAVSWNTNGTKTVDLTVTDNGCTGTTSQSITIANTAAADAGSDIQLCPGVAGALGSTPVSGYTYSWAPAWGLSSTTVANPAITIPGNPTGAIIDTFYIVTATTGVCSATDTVNVRIYPDIDNSFVVSTHSACAGDPITVTYAGTVSATATYTWNFSGANVLSGSGAGPYQLSWTAQGSYSVSLSTTDNGCTATASSTTITIGTRPTAYAGNDTTVCSGTSVQLGAAATAGVTYAWTPAANLSGATAADPVFSQTNTSGAAVVNNYMLIATGGCADTAYVNVTVTPVSPMTIAASGPVSFCQGDSVVLSDNLAPQSDYLWSSGDTTATITVRNSGTYTLTAHDAAGCAYISNPSVTVTANAKPAPVLAPNGEVDQSCPGMSDGSLTVTTATGTAPYTYTWNTTPAQSGPTASGLDPGIYTVSVSDANNCTGSVSYTVQAAPAIALDIDSLQNLSCNSQSDGHIHAVVLGGTAPASYLWSTGATTQGIYHLPAGSYSVTATDAHGCTVDSTVAITQPQPITFTTVSPLLISYGGSESIQIDITPAGNYSYAWTPSTGLSCDICPNPVASPLQTTMYILTVTDPVGGCSGIDTITLYVDASKHFYVPNAFTPNSDGINDVFYVFPYGPVKVFEMDIFDRWGERVYFSNDIGSGWDGTYHGVYMNPGDYVYTVTITYADGQTMASKGTITLIR